MTTAPSTERSSVTLIAPMLAVPDVAAAVAYYRDKLGFTVVGLMGEPPDYGIVERDSHMIHFLRSTVPLDARGAFEGSVERSKGGIYIDVQDVDAIASEVVGRGASGQIEPENKPYGMRDFWIADLNGYIVAFGTKIKV